MASSTRLLARAHAGKTIGARTLRATPIAPARVPRARVVTAQASSKKGKVKKVVLAYSGGLDTSIILKWLQDEYGCEVVTFTADLGQVGGHHPQQRVAPMLMRKNTLHCGFGASDAGSRVSMHTVFWQGEELEPARAKAEKMGVKQIFVREPAHGTLPLRLA